MDGDTRYNGRVELCEGEQWLSICDSEWSHKEATVACRQLELPGKCKVLWNHLIVWK